MASQPQLMSSNETKWSAAPSSETQDHEQSEQEKLPADGTGDSSAQSRNNVEPARMASNIDPSDFASGFRLFIIMISLMLSIFLVALDTTIVGTAIPKITDEFHSLQDVGWYGSAFFLTVAASESTWGKACKYFPVKLVFLLAIFIFEVGSLVCAVAPNSTALIVGRAIAGLGGAGFVTCAYTILGFSVSPQKRAAFTGLLGATFATSAVLGPLVGGAFTSKVTWRWCFYINLPIGGLAGAFITAFLKTPRSARPQPATAKEKILQMDLPGTFTLLAAMVCFLLAMQWGGATKPWSDAKVIATLVVFGVLMIIFVIIEYVSGDRALLQGRLLKDRTLMAMSAYMFFTAAVFYILLYFLPIYFQSTRGLSASRSGVDNLPIVIGSGIFTMVSGIVISGTGVYIPLMVASSIFASVGSGLIYTLTADSPARKWIGYQVIAAIGLGLGFQIPVMVCQATAKPADLSSVSAMLLFFQTMGGAIFISAAQAGFINQIAHELVHSAPGINPAQVIATGATELRSVFTPQELPGIIQAYIVGLRTPYAISIACGGIAFFLAFTPRWERVKVDASAATA